MEIVFSEKHKLHATDAVLWEGAHFITEEIPDRAEIMLSALQSAEIGNVTAPSEHGIDPILAVHDRDFITYLRNAYLESSEYFGEAGPVFPHVYAVRQARRKPNRFLGQRGYYAFSAGTPILKGTWQAAYWSAQCALTATDHLLAGEQAAYALCRPPGHHAAHDMYGGSCFINNAAIAARYLQDGNARVAILDIDYHHGNGTQEIFYDDPQVMFCSLHAHPDDDYPYFWGGSNERGEGSGEGTNWNWPLPQGIDDKRYLSTLALALDVIDNFSPKYLIVSAGFDILAGDPVGGFAISNMGLKKIGYHIANLDIPTVIVQEGGYLLDMLGKSAVTFLSAFR